MAEIDDEQAAMIARMANAEVGGAHGPEGRAAVEAVIMNRMRAGTYGGSHAKEVLNKYNQFEPVKRSGGWDKFMARTDYAPTPEQIKATKEHFARRDKPDYSDPSGGAYFFYNPDKAEMAWEGTPTKTYGTGTGRHQFFTELKSSRRKGSDRNVQMAGYSSTPTAPRGRPEYLAEKKDIGDLAEPSLFVQDEPPKDDNEFQTRFQEIRSALSAPSTQAALLQFALAAVQPRAPGQSVVGHLASAAGSGGEAAQRYTDTEEARRLRAQKEVREERTATREDTKIDVDRERIAEQARQADQTAAGVSRGQDITAKHYGDQGRYQEAVVAQSRDNHLLAIQNAKNSEKRADRTELRGLLTIQANAWDKAIDDTRTLLEGLPKDSPDRARLTRDMQIFSANRADVAKRAGALELEMTPAPKTPAAPAAPTPESKLAADKGEPLTVTDEQLAALRTKYTDDQLRERIDAKRLKLTEDQAESFRLIERRPDPLGKDMTFGQRVGSAWRSGVEGVQKEADTRLGRGLPAEIAEASKTSTGVPVTTRAAFSKLPKAEQDSIRAKIAEALPDKKALPKDPDSWKAIFSSEVAEDVARDIYTPVRINQMKRDLQTAHEPGPSAGKARAREAKEAAERRARGEAYR